MVTCSVKEIIAMAKSIGESQYSSEYQELSRLFFSITPPFSEQDVKAFNRLYRKIYSSLPPHEKRKAEWLVDMAIASVEKPELAKLIYGVV